MCVLPCRSPGRAPPRTSQPTRTQQILGDPSQIVDGQREHSGQAGPDHPTLPQLAETGYLKALFFRLDG